MVLNFSSALIVFAVILTPFYLLALSLSKIDRTRQQSERARRTRTPIEVVLETLREKKPYFKKGTRVQGAALSSSQKALISIVVSLTILGIPLRLASFFNAIQLYLVAFALIAGILLALWLLPGFIECQIAALSSTLVLHLLIHCPLPVGIKITERSCALAKIILEGSWNPSWRLLNVYYNPFPMDQGLFSILLEIISIDPINAFGGWIVEVLFKVAFNLTFYSLVKKISGSWRAGVLGVILLTFTPPTFINAQPQWLSILFSMISILALFRMLIGKPSISNMIVANMSYVVAILTHAVATMTIFLIPGVLVVSCFTSKVEKVEMTRLSKNSILRMSLFVLTVITLVRWVHVAGVLEGIVDPFKSFVMGLLGYNPEWIGAQYTPLYDRYVPPIQAYAWSTPVAMASALAFQYPVKKRISRSAGNTLTLGMYITGSAFLIIGFLGSLFSSHMGFQRYMGYPSFVFIIPAAAMVGKIVLRSSRYLRVAFIALIILQCGIALNEPTFYEEMNTVNPASTGDYLETRSLSHIIPIDKLVVAPYEMLVSFSYLGTVEGKTVTTYAGSLKVHRILVDQAIEDKEVLAEVIYIWTHDVGPLLANSSVNILYDSGGHIVFNGVGDKNGTALSP